MASLAILVAAAAEPVPAVAVNGSKPPSSFDHRDVVKLTVTVIRTGTG
jgi:hypothetical protein